MAGDEMAHWHWCLESWFANATSIRVFSIIIKVRTAITKLRFKKKTVHNLVTTETLPSIFEKALFVH